MAEKLILCSHDGKLGDAVVMTGLVEALHCAGYSIYVTASRGNLSFWQADRRLSGVVEVPKNGLIGKLLAILQLRRIKASNLFSWDLHRSTTGMVLARFSGARRKVGFWTEGLAVFDVILPFDPACEHIIRKYERAAALLGIPLAPPKLGFSVMPSGPQASSGYARRVFVNFLVRYRIKVSRSKACAQYWTDCPLIFLIPPSTSAI
jgi:ADP-heptose:LPS heptosyltransferase